MRTLGIIGGVGGTNMRVGRLLMCIWSFCGLGCLTALSVALGLSGCVGRCVISGMNEASSVSKGVCSGSLLGGGETADDFSLGTMIARLFSVISSGLPSSISGISSLILC